MVALLGATPALAHSGPAAQNAGSPSQTDARWAAMMVDHHQNGIELTELALQKSHNSGVRAVATQSKADQQRQLPGLQAVAKAGGMKAMPPEAPLARFNEQQMATLKKLSGDAFDRMWLDVFSSHHMAAIVMTDVAVAGSRSDLAGTLQNEL